MMLAPIDRQPHCRPGKYLELEINAAERHEFFNGEIIPIAGGLPNHNKITGNLYANLNFLLKPKPDEAYMADQRLWIHRRIYTYPDVMVMAQSIGYAEGRRDTLINPILIAEVLAESTQDYDQGGKFAAYRTIATCKNIYSLAQLKSPLSTMSKWPRANGR